MNRNNMDEANPTYRTRAEEFFFANLLMFLLFMQDKLGEIATLGTHVFQIWGWVRLKKEKEKQVLDRMLVRSE